MGPAESPCLWDRGEGEGAALRGRQAGGPVTALRKAEVPKRGRAGGKEAWVPAGWPMW